MSWNRKILFVDDDQNVLDAMKRNLRRIFDVHTAAGGEAGLEVLEAEGPFAVVVSDMSMPGMSGVDFLAEVCRRSPDTVRIMLTGRADLESAMNAVNEGNIFRFITKPANAKLMASSLKSAFDQYRLLTSEKELLENTLKASVNVLVDMLSIANPAAFSQSMRIRDIIRLLIGQLHLEAYQWQYELAAMLSHLGCVTVPAETMGRYLAGEELSRNEEQMIQEHPDTAYRLIHEIPRLEDVAEIIRQQFKDPAEIDTDQAIDPEAVVDNGACLLRAAITYDMLLSRGLGRSQALMTMQTDEHVYHPKVLAVLGRVELPEREQRMRVVRIGELQNGMVLAGDVKSRSGVLIVTRGQVVTDTLRRCLQNNSVQNNIPDTVKVSVSQ